MMLLCVVILSGCATAPQPKFCESNSLSIDAAFEGGNFYRCALDGVVASIEIRPEDKPPINQSPWYALRVNPKTPTEATIHLTFVDGYARYWPKTSKDRMNWTRLPEHAVTFSDDGRKMTLSLPVDEMPHYVSAQPLTLPSWYEAWMNTLAARPDVRAHVVSHSVHGHPIYALRTGDTREIVFLFGRQHPPEVTGAFAMRSFVTTVLDDTALGEQFRERFSLVIVPLINPDGVALGHWRHNVNGVDLNRDWGPFSQPETQGLYRLVDELEEFGAKFRLMLDFHSTRESLFYTQMADEFTEPVDFATAWLGNSKARLPDFEFKHDPRPPSEQANTKNYFFSRFAIPAITYEIGDEVDREAIEQSTPVFAEEMMRELLRR